jgi:hypothetical protein
MADPAQVRLSHDRVTMPIEGKENSMGAWGCGSFENDDALDFLAEAAESGDLSLLGEVFDNVLTSTEYVDASDASQAIAAAEMVAAAQGRPTLAAQKKEEIADWLRRVRPKIDAALAAQASEALSRILSTNSELRELWEESDEPSEWQACVNELKSHLS